MDKTFKVMWEFPVGSLGLSPHGVTRVRGMLLAALDAVAGQIETATDLGCDPGVQRAMVAGLRGEDQALRRDI